MSDLIMIQPASIEIARGVPALEIRLGGTQRGFIVLLVDSDCPEIEVVEAMNTFAAEGFESLCVVEDAGVESLALARAAEAGFDAEQIGIVGLGCGATAVLDIARRQSLGAAVSLSPEPDLAAVTAQPELRTPWLGMFGAESSVGEDVVQLRRLLESSSAVYSQVVVYAGVGSDFHRRSETGISFAASYDGWQRTVEWLLARVASRLTPLALEWRKKQGARVG